jgi:hypothetical protein
MYTVVKAGEITSLEVDTPILKQKNFSTVEKAYSWIDKDRVKEGVTIDVSERLRTERVKRINAGGFSYTLVRTSL